MSLNISIVVPVYNESLNIKQLKNEIFLYLKNINFELIFVNDASNDDSNSYLEKFKNINNIKVITHKLNKGQSKSLYTGIKIASYNTIVTIDGDCQNDPKDILKFLEIYHKEKNKKIFISGVRNKRKDSILKIFSSKIANKARDFFLKDGCPDTGCSLKIFPKEYFLKLPFFDGMHRFLPALFIALHLQPIYIDVNHRERVFGNSKYGIIDRLIIGIKLLYKVKKIIKNLKKT